MFCKAFGMSGGARNQDTLNPDKYRTTSLVEAGLNRLSGLFGKSR